MATPKRTRTSRTSVEPEGPRTLTTRREEGERQIAERIAAGRELAARDVGSQSDYETLRNEYTTWSEFNADLLEALFTDSRERKKYQWWGIASPLPESLTGRVRRLREDIDDKVQRLESVRARLALAIEPSEVGRPAVHGRASPTSTSVFLVHGHDDATKQTVARFIEKLGLDVVILHEQANKGRTVIEKFEDHADVGYAVVLLTPDDVGGPADDPVAVAPRARQNVVFELGFFYGSLGRERVSALLLGPIERPTDIAGVVYIDMADGSWPLQLAKELKAAGLPVDMNRAV